MCFNECMEMVKVKEWGIPEDQLVRLFRMFIPYREKHGLELGFELFFEDYKDFCVKSGVDAIETILLHNWKGKLRYENGKKYRYVKREHTDAEWQVKLREYNCECAYCGEVAQLTKDHIIPVSKGGSDKIANIVPACWPCNRSKGVSEWQIQCASV